MPVVTLKSLHAYLKLLENAAELKRRMPGSTSPRTLKEGLQATSRLVGVEDAVFRDPQHIAALIGAPRFVMIGGEPSATDQVVRIFDSSRVLLTVLMGRAHGGDAPSNPPDPIAGIGHRPSSAPPALASDRAPSKGEPPAAGAPLNAEPETPLDSLMPLLEGNAPLSCRLFRVLFEHMLGFAMQSSAPQANIALVNDLTGSKEHGRSFLSTALFVLGAEIDRDNLVPFMVQQGLFGMPIFEHLLQNRDYCDAFHTFRRLERAFTGSVSAEEVQLRNRLDRFNAQFGGKPYGAKVFEPAEQDKANIDAYLAAADLLEVLALTPWGVGLSRAVALASTNSIRSISTIARHFARFRMGEATRDQANREIAEHLLAFARQFSADSKPASLPTGSTPSTPRQFLEAV